MVSLPSPLQAGHDGHLYLKSHDNSGGTKHCPGCRHTYHLPRRANQRIEGTHLLLHPHLFLLIHLMIDHFLKTLSYRKVATVQNGRWLATGHLELGSLSRIKSYNAYKVEFFNFGTKTSIYLFIPQSAMGRRRPRCNMSSYG
jgi:hypothetical protein